MIPDESPLTLEQRVRTVERALAELESRQHIYLGLCLNAGCGSDERHPHWDDEHVMYGRLP